MEKTHYRLEFPLSAKPAYRRRFELLDKMETLKKLVKQKGHTGERGLSNLSCYAPYSNFAICTLSAGGETEWLPNMMKELSQQDEKLQKIWIEKIAIEPIRPSAKARKAEADWVEKASEEEKERIIEEREEIKTVERGMKITRKQLKEKKVYHNIDQSKLIQRTLEPDEELRKKLSKD